jgi:hypothetical protein
MNCDVETHEFPEVVVFESELVCEVSAVVKGSVSGWDLGVVAVLVVENNGCNSGNLSTNIKGIFEGRLPVFGLVDAVLVGLSKVRAGLTHEDTC